MNYAEIADEKFRAKINAITYPSSVSTKGTLSDHKAINIFRAQSISRNLDLTARKMQAAGQGFYTIGSSGHEGMAAIAAALRPNDMAFLHYRDAAFQIMRAFQLPNTTPAWDIILSFAASSEDPISGGRHKVLGSKALMIPPQTSTIASHLPKSIGAAYSIGLAKKFNPEHQILDKKGLVFCSFGDASVNHSTAQGAFNAACWASYQSVPLPLLFVCEDNNIGLSVPTPKNWIANCFSQKAGLRYFHANGLDMFETYRVATAAARIARTHKKPVFLHLSVVRLFGHAGSDVQEAYLDQKIIKEWENNDPLIHSARLLIQSNILNKNEILQIYDQEAAHCAKIAENAIKRPRLQNARDVMASLIPPKRQCVPTKKISNKARIHLFANNAQSFQKPQPMSQLLNWGLTDLMLAHDEIIMVGEDIGKKGGIYGITKRLQERFGQNRVIDSLLDEQSILGLAIGLAHNGFIPIPEIQFLAYLHNAEDQIRGEAATLPFFSNGQFTNPMIIRIAGLGYQKGFGGHFHNDNSLSVLRDIPGLILAVPSQGADGVKMLRSCFELAHTHQRIIAFVEPIALYSTRDLHAKKDGGWMQYYPDKDEFIQLGEIGISGEGALAILTYANGHYLSQKAAPFLHKQGIDTRIVDLRWLSPLPEENILKALDGAKKVLIVDECRKSGNVSEALATLLGEKTTLPFRRLTAEDSFIATGPAYGVTLPSCNAIIKAALDVWHKA